MPRPLTSTEKGRALRARRAARGLCVACGVVPPKPGRRRCFACCAEAVERKNDWRTIRRADAEAADLCICGRRLEAGRRACIVCRLVARRRQRRRRAARRKEVAHG